MQRKIFNHNFVQPYELETETIDGLRYYVLPDGDKLKSVTTILSEKLDKSALQQWKKRVGEEEAAKVMAHASRRGTALHAIAEKYVLNDPDYKKGSMPVNIASFMHIQEILNKNVDNIYGVELALFSKTLKAAGRSDLVAEFNGVPTIIDFKTSKKAKKKEWIEGYFLQSTIYSMMFERLYGIQIPQIAILITVDDDLPQTFVEDRGKYVKRVLEIFA